MSDSEIIADATERRKRTVKKPALAEKGKPATDEDFWGAQRRKEIALANLRELEHNEKTGQLVSRTEVETAAFNQARLERDALMAWPSRVSPLIAAALSVDEKQLYVVLDRHVREFLEERPASPKLLHSESAA